MFIKILKKEDKTYYLLTTAEKVEKGKGQGKNKDTIYHSFFINSEFAENLIKLGCPTTEKECK